MRAEDAVARTKHTISRWGGAFMLDPATAERGAELGLAGFPFYYLGRCGVLGDVDADVVAAAMVFFPPGYVRKSWEKGRAVLAPAEGAAHYAEACRTWGRTNLAAAQGLDRFCEVAERLVGAADPAGMPLFAGWRGLPLPDDLPGRAAQLLNVLREHRGAAHAIAVLSQRLTPIEAIVAGSHGADSARFFGWPEPYPRGRPGGRAPRRRRGADRPPGGPRLRGPRRGRARRPRRLLRAHHVRGQGRQGGGLEARMVGDEAHHLVGRRGPPPQVMTIEQGLGPNGAPTAPDLAGNRVPTPRQEANACRAPRGWDPGYL